MFAGSAFAEVAFTDLAFAGTPILPIQIIWGGAGTYKGELDYKYDEEDDEEMIIMALAHQLIEMRVI
jgi:hypothetical protein